MTRKEWERRRDAYARAMRLIAIDAGMGSKITKAMGPVAWGRYEGEDQPGQLVSGVAFGCGYLHGMRDTLMRVGRTEGWPDTHLLERIHERLKEDAH